MFSDLIQILIYAALLVGLAVPIGLYMARVYSGELKFLRPLERGIFAVAGVKPDQGQHWSAYALSLLAFNAAGFLLLFLILKFQDLLPFNPAGFPGLPADLAFNTTVSYITNTNWQSYGGESTLSNFSQMAGLTTQNFLSAATGMAVAAAVARGLAARQIKAIGNFWVDMVRSTLYVLLPLAIILAIVL
ncbi:MAG: potassium-transporting ATPase subunit KdpA, partial [Devosia nanyangense]|nr:potassium-transporting ATPase subunit KdpA [Devosia nanyangense]